jgi:ferredoxin-NADP reductase
MPGSLLDVEGPVGRFTFPDDTDATRLLFVAGGSGIAPLRAMLHHALRTRTSRIDVVYSARTAQDFAFIEELQTLDREGRIALHQTVTREPESSGWSGGTGRLTGAAIAPLLDPAHTLCFVCGPQSMVKDVPALLMSHGMARNRVRIEEWG